MDTPLWSSSHIGKYLTFKVIKSCIPLVIYQYMRVPNLEGGLLWTLLMVIYQYMAVPYGHILKNTSTLPWWWSTTDKSCGHRPIHASILPWSTTGNSLSKLLMIGSAFCSIRPKTVARIKQVKIRHSIYANNLTLNAIYLMHHLMYLIHNWL